MKKSKFIIIILILIVIIGPFAFNKINEKSRNKEAKVESKLKIENRNCDYIGYKGSLVSYDGKNVKGFNKKGKPEVETSIISNKYKLHANTYIDIINEEKGIIYSINEKGNIVFTKNMPYKLLGYKSINDNLFSCYYSDKNDEYIDLYDIDGSKISTIKINGKLLDIDQYTNEIITTSINIDKGIKSFITKYDQNGNEIKKISLNKELAMATNLVKDKIFCVTSDSVYVLDKDLNTKEIIKANMIIKSIDSTDKTLYLVDNKDKLYFIDKSYKIKPKKLDINNIKGIKSTGKSLLVYSDDETLQLDSNTKNKFKFDIKNAIPLDNDLEALISTDNIYITKID